MWAYSGLALETRTSADYRYVKGQLQRSRKQISIRGLNKDHNHDLKGLFKAAATMASVRPGPFQEFYESSLAKGIKPTMVRLSLARKIAAIPLPFPTQARSQSRFRSGTRSEPCISVRHCDHDYYFELLGEEERDAQSISRCSSAHHGDVRAVPRANRT
jgi:hypothetical protein